MHGLRRFFTKLDAVYARVERLLLLVSLVMMTVLVFSDVVLRSFTRPVGKTAGLLLWLLEGAEPLAKSTHDAVANVWGPALFGLIILMMCVFGVHAGRTAGAEQRGASPPPFSKSAAAGLVLFVVLWASVKLLIWVFPTGVAGAQRFALGFMVWAGFLGASLATRAKRHIALDAVTKKLDAVAYPWFSALGGLVTAAFTFVVTWLAISKLRIEIEEWLEIPNVGVFESLPIPVWIVTLALPLTFGTIGLRFLAYGLSDLLYGPSLLVEPDDLAKEIKKLEQENAPKQAPPFDNGTRYGELHPTRGRPVKREVAS